jgi:hypothetical protein
MDMWLSCNVDTKLSRNMYSIGDQQADEILRVAAEEDELCESVPIRVSIVVLTLHSVP